MAKAKKHLVIVESPSKAKTINKFLGKDYKVTASVGHIIDLPKSKLGVNIEDGFKPQYVKIRGKASVIKTLKDEAAKADKVYLATDPDREGEAIAWHISSILGRDSEDVSRIEFNEITSSAVNRAIESPREIDMARVYSQQARRVLDRIVGYQVSPVLWKTVYRGLSAGRVQSVALKLVCEREQQIRDFIPREFWTISITTSGESGQPFSSKLTKMRTEKSGKFGKIEITNGDEAKTHVENIKQSELYISKLAKREVKKHPSPPFITSTLQQSAARALRMSTSRIMQIAQQLYEGIEVPGKGSVGLITYMRTDSTRISAEAMDNVRSMIDSQYGPDFLPEKARYFKSKKSAQDAHEAIRPSYIAPEFAPANLKEHLSPQQFRLYNLIWSRFVASQMTPARFDKTTVEITGGNYLFTTEGEVMTFEGFLKVYGLDIDDNDDPNSTEQPKIPAGLKEKESLNLNKIDPKQNFTKPPARYTESSLVKELDSLGIGRPSTYASIISTLLHRKYSEKNENKLFATELGETVNKILVKHFPQVFDVQFTARMETDLDRVAANELKYNEVLEEFYNPFKVALEKADSLREEIRSDLQEEAGENCENCGRPMVIRWGRNGRFMACSGYPECRNTKPLEDTQEPVDYGEKCDKCGKPMVVKVGRFGQFLACSDYPTCKNAKPIPLGIKCPKDGCDGDVVARKSKRGRNFYGCSNYPKCDFVSWDKPVNEACEECGHAYIVEKYTKARGNFLQCPECKHTKQPVTSTV